MTQLFLALRTFQFANGTQVSVPLRACESIEDAKKLASEDSRDMNRLLRSRLATPASGTEWQDVGMNAGEFLKSLGLTGIVHGCQTVEKDSPILTPQLILGAH